MKHYKLHSPIEVLSPPISESPRATNTWEPICNFSFLSVLGAQKIQTLTPNQRELAEKSKALTNKKQNFVSLWSTKCAARLYIYWSFGRERGNFYCERKRWFEKRSKKCSCIIIMYNYIVFLCFSQQQNIKVFLCIFLLPYAIPNFAWFSQTSKACLWSWQLEQCEGVRIASPFSPLNPIMQMRVL